MTFDLQYDARLSLLNISYHFQHITFVQIFRICETIISSNHGHLLLKAVIKDLKDSMGPSFVKSKWQESGLKLKDWMSEDQVSD